VQRVEHRPTNGADRHAGGKGTDGNVEQSAHGRQVGRRRGEPRPNDRDSSGLLVTVVCLAIIFIGPGGEFFVAR
jgi:hypothetical protein